MIRHFVYLLIYIENRYPELISITNTKITMDGLQYLEENSRTKKR
ncbi:MAG: hypothetical protein J6D36_00440 [Erysipelotrichaceae bacterium]|nr:hypothetical protein [Erysipelotrichaceae bacterium]